MKYPLMNYFLSTIERRKPKAVIKGPIVLRGLKVLCLFIISPLSWDFEPMDVAFTMWPGWSIYGPVYLHFVDCEIYECIQKTSVKTSKPNILKNDT